MTNCLECAVGVHAECVGVEVEDIGDDVLVAIACCCSIEMTVGTSEGVVTVIGGYKENEEVTDPTSTGRKRAAKLKPIVEGMQCEWSNLVAAGGGVVPIVGCEGTKLTQTKGRGDLTGNVHHGPDKSTLNNSYENLHGICGKCHNRWHALNDPHYPQGRPANGDPYIPEGGYVPHDRHTLATTEQLRRSEIWWTLPKDVRPEYTTYVIGVQDA